MKKNLFFWFLLAIVCLPTLCLGGYKINDLKCGGTVERLGKKIDFINIDLNPKDKTVKPFQLQDGDIVRTDNAGFLVFFTPRHKYGVKIGPNSEMLIAQDYYQGVLINGAKSLVEFEKEWQAANSLMPPVAAAKKEEKKSVTGRPPLAKIPPREKPEKAAPVVKEIKKPAIVPPPDINDDKTVKAAPALPPVDLPKVGPVPVAPNSTEIKVKIKNGDVLCKILQKVAEEKGLLSFSGSNEEKTAKITNFIENKKQKAEELKEKVGLIYGIDLIKPGQVLDLTEVFADELESKNTFKLAENLNDTEINFILANNKKIANWLSANPGQRLTTEKTREILRPEVVIVEENKTAVARIAIITRL